MTSCQLQPAADGAHTETGHHHAVTHPIIPARAGYITPVGAVPRAPPLTPFLSATHWTAGAAYVHGVSDHRSEEGEGGSTIHSTSANDSLSHANYVHCPIFSITKRPSLSSSIRMDPLQYRGEYIEESSRLSPIPSAAYSVQSTPRAKGLCQLTPDGASSCLGVTTPQMAAYYDMPTHPEPATTPSGPATHSLADCTPVVKRQQAVIDELRAKVDHLEDEIPGLRARAAVLEQQQHSPLAPRPTDSAENTALPETTRGSLDGLIG